MQIPINENGIIDFIVSVTFDIKNRTVLFDTSQTTYDSGAISTVLGISFFLEDEQGISLATIDFSDTANYIVPSVEETFTVDLSASSYAFLFQVYKIYAAIKGADGTIYTIPFVYKNVCEPVNFTSSGYVPGTFQIIPDCTNNSLSVKELTLLVYNHLTPSSTSKDGTLYYPTGTIDPITFTGTPFSNNVIYTGEMRIVDTTIGTYDLSDGVYVLVNYYTSAAFNITCSNRMTEVLCCILDLQNTYQLNCNNAKGQNALAELQSVSFPFFIGTLKEMAGQDASEQVIEIKKTLKCNCGVQTISQNEPSPINPTVYSIILSGLGGTTVPSTTTVGNTKTYYIASNSYQVAKGNPSDLAFSISLDTSTQYVVKYKITFNYTQLATTILNTIAGNDTLLALFNSLINVTANVSLIGLDGSCIIDLTTADYFLTQAITTSTTVVNIVIGGVTYTAPVGLLANDAGAFQSWLNSLTKGTFAVSNFTDGSVLYVAVLSNANSNIVSTLTLNTTSDVTYRFGATTKTLIQVLQAMIDWMCNVSYLNIKLGTALSLCTFDYNGNVVTTTYSEDTLASDYEAAVAEAICNHANWISNVTNTTCDTMKQIFQSFPAGVFGSGDMFYGTLGGSCFGISREQAALAIIDAINNNSTVKTAFCAIDCGSPATCPDISNTSLAMSGSDIGVYGLTWTPANPSASQTVTVSYRVNGDTTWIVATNALLILPNGNLSGTTPYLITGVNPATTYQVWIQNNCGGTGFIKNITTPSSTVYADDYFLDTVLYNICGTFQITLYSSAPFAEGVTLYTDIGLTTPATGSDYVCLISTGAIHEIDNATGVVGVDTGLVCGGGVLGSYRLGNDSGTICAASLTGLYTSGAFAIGGVLYLDSSLSTPVTGYVYVVDTATNIIYNLNTSTGEVGASTGLSCADNTVQITSSMAGVTLTAVSGISGFTPSPALPLSTGGATYGTHGAFTGTINLTLTGSLAINPSNIAIYKNGVLQQCLNITSVGVKTLASNTYAASDVITISLNLGGC